MQNLHWILQFLITLAYAVNEHHKPNPKIFSNVQEKPLILTPLIKQGQIEEARAAAEVKFSDFKNVKSYSGYFTVNDQFNSNLFFWFFPSKTYQANSPVLLWLEGGPGGSTLPDIFMGNGPFTLSDSGLELGKDALTENMSVIYIDNPVGTGYSFTDEGGYAQNQTTVRAQLYEALLQFFQLFPEFQLKPFFIGGISYAGKYVPAVSYTIHQNNPGAKQKINLQGLVIGNGLVDPEHQTGYAEYLYQVGLTDSKGRLKMETMEQKLLMDINNSRWANGFVTFNSMVLGAGLKNTLFSNLTGFKYHLSYLEPGITDSMNDQLLSEQYLQRKDVKRAIHVANTTYHSQNNQVLFNLALDISQSVSTWLSELLSHYRVLIYNGQLDVICAYPLTVNFIKNLNFTGSKQYQTGSRRKWYVGADLSGYIKQAGNLTEVLVRNAGHVVHWDQPSWLQHLINNFMYTKLL